MGPKINTARYLSFLSTIIYLLACWGDLLPTLNVNSSLFFRTPTILVGLLIGITHNLRIWNWLILGLSLSLSQTLLLLGPVWVWVGGRCAVYRRQWSAAFGTAAAQAGTQCPTMTWRGRTPWYDQFVSWRADSTCPFPRRKDAKGCHTTPPENHLSTHSNTKAFSWSQCTQGSSQRCNHSYFNHAC